jgi:hypothetical protein
MQLSCALCGGVLRPTAITAEGATYACPCGRTTWTQLNKGKLDLGLPERPGDSNVGFGEVIDE